MLRENQGASRLSSALAGDSCPFVRVLYDSGLYLVEAHGTRRDQASSFPTRKEPSQRGLLPQSAPAHNQSHH